MKKQKDYPDECAVFEVIDELEPRFGEHFQFESWDEAAAKGWTRFWWPLHARHGENLVDYFDLGQVRPLTPAAEDLLAAIRTELGQ